MRESIDKFIKGCWESRLDLMVFFQREKAPELLKIQKTNNKNKTSYKQARHKHLFRSQTFECLWAECHRKFQRQKDE